MEGINLFTTEFNIDGKIVQGFVRQTYGDVFIEVRCGDNTKKKIYNGSILNQDQMLLEMESLVEELCSVD